MLIVGAPLSHAAGLSEDDSQLAAMKRSVAWKILLHWRPH